MSDMCQPLHDRLVCGDVGFGRSGDARRVPAVKTMYRGGGTGGLRAAGAATL
ncbi:hypothetical protein KCP71_21470 [Salmonella enterica subsp. enterica]|nr:hypothetical protein KCP71_21470 [Salmonella enterica subsp. enterica]